MFKAIQTLLCALILALFVAMPGGNPAARAAEATSAMLNALASDNFKAIEDAVNALAATGDAAVVPALEALADGELYFRKADKQVFITEKSGSKFKLIDPLTQKPVGEEAKTAIDKIKVNNSLRRSIRDALGGLTLQSKDRAVRLTAAQTILKSPNGEAVQALDAALAKETDGEVKKVLTQARAASVLLSNLGPDEKSKAIAEIRAVGGQDSLSLLSSIAGTVDDSLKPQVASAIASINSSLELWNAAQYVWYGISLSSVLLLAAIGLAITFGVMGIINMAHGEMVMLGAYSTYVVQEVIRQNAPGLFDWSLAIALPIAFIVAALVGLAIERIVIRHLYGRPLETLLATWGISLILQQTVRSIFGANNREVGNPSWMSGAFELGGLTITWNRMWIVIFTLGVFFALLTLLKRSPIGLQMRAVTQNRRMASSMGIRTPWVDAMTFALGSGIAGIAGVALSQIDNVSPNLGQGYIIDSFMVVVFGGVGNLWGTLVGALSLGIVNKFLEPYAGAVLGKIIVLVLIILFIQKRPRGLFALKGRAVEA
ncbi:urea ABC transporter permease subunit UrtB [Rhizobium sp. C4]|nr:urea ABC transporter permease subunit UrtB [Rhizobium sp. C4]MCD2173814.1 urea ABC transporter permease subunit UrtB [Rhizobium sp. C4]